MNNSQRHNILVVDDEEAQRSALDGFLKKLGFNVLTAPDGPQALDFVQKQSVDLVLTDYKMPKMSGYDLLLHIKKLRPLTIVIVITAFGNIEDAVAAMKAGAFDYLTKPIDLDAMELIIQRALNFHDLKKENEYLRQQLKEVKKPVEIISQSVAMEEVLSIVMRAADSKVSILIEGESGTGKELIAQAIHQASARRFKPLIVVNCAALSENLLESELFGHEKGAFTGAIQQRKGKFEEADGGSLFLDEIGEVPLSLQVKLLRFLQFGQFERVGSNETQTVNVRIIAATNRNLNKMISNGTFREDLYYRLNVVRVSVPPLRSRREDILLLINYFLNKSVQQYGKSIDGLSHESLDILLQYDFPGNVRELQNIIERAVVLCRGNLIRLDDLPDHMLKLSQGALNPVYNETGSLTERVGAFERSLIVDALERAENNQSAAARELGIGERQFRYKLNKYKIKKTKNGN